MCKPSFEDKPVKSIVLNKRGLPGHEQYYVHYENYNRRLDEWVTRDKFNFDKMFPMEPQRRRDTSTSRKAADSNRDIQSPSPSPSPSAQQQQQQQQIRQSPSRTLANSLSSNSNLISNSNISESAPIMPAVQSSTGGVQAGVHFEALVRNVDRIVLGMNNIDTWYYSPFPKDVLDESGYSECIWICEFCLSHFSCQRSFERHMRKCKMFCPPGDEIFRQDNLSVFEVDGIKQRIYCQNLALISKLFLDHKTLFYDVDPFLFYILTEVDDRGCHLVGYFSKEKDSPDGYNLSCIMVLPPYQQNGYGRFLIAFSYELSKKEGKSGSPEKPLSDLGLLSFYSYWKYELVRILKDASGPVSINDLSMRTSITTEDINSTLSRFGMFVYYSGGYVINVSNTLTMEHERKHPKIMIQIQNLHWTPRNFEQPSEKKH
ncbi:MAG: putative Histone acetyltransferase KAT8 [Streblomastix strix]|uniref:Histone acetyltransferase n=1 Tax=Streblomastix strix TaxID=222440 RepID=A0A5J4VZ83_9EUKA|nr:MAG: putative Histone acetyltransferase KAT8 [Streblomastix strix]